MIIKVDNQGQQDKHARAEWEIHTMKKKRIWISNAHGWIDYIPFVMCIRYYLWAAHKSTQSRVGCR